MPTETKTMEVSARDRAKAMVLQLLESRRRKRVGELPRKATAAGIARWLGTWSSRSRESQRRIVRDIIKQLREEGHAILGDCSPTNGGYWLADTSAELSDYKDVRHHQAIANFASASTVTRGSDACDIAGQLSIFNVGPSQTKEPSSDHWWSS